MRIVRNTFIIFFALVFVPFLLSAGNGNQPAGARRISLGNAYTGVRADFWSLFANPAGIAGIGGMQAGVYMERRFLLEELNYGAAGFVMPFMERHYAGFDFSGFGFGTYNEARLGLTYATTILDRLSLGAKLNYTRTSILGYGASAALFVDAGLIARISDDFSVGFRVFNANQADIKRQIEERIPTTLDLGLAYQASDKVLIVADIEKQVNFPTSFRGGVEYAFLKNFKARVGASTQPVTINAGIGLSLKSFDVDFANSYHEYLGYTPSLSLNYRFNSKK